MVKFLPEPMQKHTLVLIPLAICARIDLMRNFSILSSMVLLS